MVKITVDGSQLQENNPTLCILPDILPVFFILFALVYHLLNPGPER